MGTTERLLYTHICPLPADPNWVNLRSGKSGNHFLSPLDSVTHKSRWREDVWTLQTLASQTLGGAPVAEVVRCRCLLTGYIIKSAVSLPPLNIQVTKMKPTTFRPTPVVI
ncbi:hypothetical protein Pcinc_002926 [Petrolisthes cinctipes]|uniref:Uncharacterized protein n=1 Tax=Petrolisthes cinctipes TaxID=88211 RepID=A0AAE1GJV3_PETCI|nr:hypothetical protein Pcinc_002926 [Petrolisthes cinctipes]